MSLDTWVSISVLVVALSGFYVSLRRELHGFRSELKTDISELRSELKTDISELRSELKTDIARLDDRVFALGSGVPLRSPGPGS